MLRTSIRPMLLIRKHDKTSLFLLGLSAAGLCVLFGSGQVSAASHSKTQVRIVPLECVIEEINNGVGYTYFLDPAECEEKLNPLSPPVLTPKDIFLSPADRKTAQADNEGQISQDPASRPNTSALTLEAGRLGKMLETRPLVKTIDTLLQLSIGMLMALPALLLLVRFGVTSLFRR